MEQIEVTEAGDSPFKVGQVVTIEIFLEVTKKVLQNGGEMPIGILKSA